jgi:hypothetical protein
MDATIPTGRAARTAWRRLGRRTKGEVLQRAAQDQGHPDPMVAGVAVGFARWERGYPRWTLLSWHSAYWAVLRDDGSPSRPPKVGADAVRR